ncbi:chitin deacetylase [Candidozyma auris]|uniref:chitin deacetylase n=2 Tax=Candidozyma auris TaxID=498019 RepID=A0A2H0ZGR8_CANAR|nr:hypothetical protein B9J08_004841 [[Candida] auris]QWW25307.1 hypothetical protein CA7LBN_004189 [[Candida] auris]
MQFFVFLASAALASPLVRPSFHSFQPKVAATNNGPLPVPKWLSDFTGIKEWPGLDPPYIPMDFIKFDDLPPQSDSWKRNLGECPRHINTREVCSFDCGNCAAHDDVYSCPKLSQTFDDGPTHFTPVLTSSLRSKATFFTIGLNVVKFPKIYRDTADKGHIMASHTWSHPFLPSLSNEQIVAQLQWSIWAMNATYGHLPKWFRPPYGGIDNRVRAIVRQFGMQSVLWDYDTRDWSLVADASKHDSEVINGVLQYKRSNGGRGLILEHDSTRRTVDVGVKLQKAMGPDQLTVPQCVGGINYIKSFGKPNI